MKLNKMDVLVDGKFGDNQIAMNKRTLDKIGVVGGFESILANELADDTVACNERTYKQLAQCPTTATGKENKADNVKVVINIPLKKTKPIKPKKRYK